MSLIGSTITVKIEKMAVGGAGLARHDGLVVFVDFAAPGDHLEIEVTEHKKNLAFGKIVRILSPGAERQTPKCSHFETCGGCSWQHLTHESQLHQKEILISDALKEIKKTHLFSIQTITPSPRFYQYRNRVQMTFDGTRFCFMGKRSHQLVPIHKCELVEEPLAEVIENVDKKLYKKGVRYDLRLDEISSTPKVTPLDDSVELVGFSQVNGSQNPQLIESVLESLKTSQQSDLFELYAGAGNFTFPILDRLHFRHLWAVEGSPALVKSAHDKITKNNISNKKLSFHLGTVQDFLQTRWPQANDVVFLDPPRIGAEELVIRTLALTKPRQILYMSCHPVTLARDLNRLLKYEPGYKIDFVKVFEMFPQTDHVESLVSLSLTQ